MPVSAKPVRRAMALGGFDDDLALLTSASFWVPPPVDPRELLRCRGAIWPKLGLAYIPWGPRPGQFDNVAMVDGIELYSLEDQAKIRAAYIARGYGSATMGPIVDAGYHGQVPACDLRDDFGVYLDAAERWEQAGVRVCHFLRPDAGNLGLAWDVDDCERELAPVFRTPRAQALMRWVCLAWEPGGRYGYNNDWWTRMSSWMAGTFPAAVRGLHLPSDQDAPVGPADDGHPDMSPWAWGNVAPFIHFWFVQNAGYTNGSSTTPTAQFIADFTAQFDPTQRGSLVDRFVNGYAGWPTFSAWPDGGIVPIPFEYAATGLYWQNWRAEDAAYLSRRAIEAGAVGYFDAGGGVV